MIVHDGWNDQDFVQPPAIMHYNRLSWTTIHFGHVQRKHLQIFDQYTVGKDLQDIV